MKRIYLLVLLPAAIIAVLVVRDLVTKKASDLKVRSSLAPSDMAQIQTQNGQNPTINSNSTAEKKFQPPIERAGERVTKKPFGIFITPGNSPIQPERFQGYHTGADFEIFPEELNQDIPIYAITSGKILMKRSVSGYGGVLVESGTLDNSPITIVYGHLNLASIGKNIGDSITSGEQMGILGKNKSAETDGERKHLHLGIRKGAGVDLRGYVNNRIDLDSWVDPMAIL